MYSVVLMMALSGGAETPDFGHRRGGCSGCSGSYGCSGGGYGCAGGMGYGGGYGCAGYGGGFGGVGCYGGVIIPSTGGTVDKKDGKEGEDAEKIKKPAGSSLRAPATILVNLPAEARLLVD